MTKIKEIKMKSFLTGKTTHDKIKRLCESSGRGLGEYMEHSYKYFEKTGVNPFLSVAESPTESIKGLTKQVNEYMKHFKKLEEKLNPLLGEIEVAHKKLSNVMENVPTKNIVINFIKKLDETIKQKNDHHKQLMDSKEQTYINQNKESESKMNELKKSLDELTTWITTIDETIKLKLSKKEF